MTQEIKVIIGITVVSVLLIFGAGFLITSQTPKTPQTATVTEEQKDVLTKAYSYKVGTDSAKVTIVEFSDFQCPACGALYPAMHEILAKYEGDVNYVYRHFPLPFHKNALVAAEAAESAGEQGKFMEMHDMLFENQEEWGESNNARQLFTKYATDLELDVDTFNKVIDDGKYRDRINADKADGNMLGVNATPTFFINGKRFQGVQPYGVLQTEIEAILKK